MDAAERVDFNPHAQPSLPADSPKPSKSSRVGLALVGLGVLLGGGLIVGSIVLLSRASSPLSAHTVTLHKGIGLIGGGTLLLGGLMLVGILLLKDKRANKSSNEPQGAAQSASLTITPEMIRNENRSEQARLLGEILAKHPGLTELRFSEEFLLLTEEMLNVLPESIERLTVCIEMDESVPTTIGMIAYKLPNLKELTVKIDQKSMTTPIVGYILSAPAVANHPHLQELYLYCDENVENNIILYDTFKDTFDLLNESGDNQHSCIIAKKPSRTI
jgi:hypothetical protein